MNSEQLSFMRQHQAQVINVTSKKQQNLLNGCIDRLINEFLEKDVVLVHESKKTNQSIVDQLNADTPGAFACEFDTTSIRPDGGFVSLVLNDKLYPVLISEVKHQGTNDKRLREGKKLQAQGNAIERLGKNVIVCRTMMINEDIFPFVAFGYGYDFQKGSKIRDRVVSINQNGALDKISVYRETPYRLQRGSFFFRYEPYSADDMYLILETVTSIAIHHYVNKYGK